VIYNAEIRLVDGFYNNTNVTTIIYAHLSAQDLEAALVKLIYGEQSFSGRLPYKVAKQESDYSSLVNPSAPNNGSIYYS